MAPSTIIVVTAASGKQGLALIRALLRKPSPTHEPIQIRAVVRDATSQRCSALHTLARKHSRLTVHTADFSSLSTLLPIFENATSLFLNTSPTFQSPKTELDHARNVLSAAQASPHLERVVYSSVIALDEPMLWRALIGTCEWAPPYTGGVSSNMIPVRRPLSSSEVEFEFEEPVRVVLQGYYSAKYAIEHLVQQQGKSWTILRPSWFMSEFTHGSHYYSELDIDGRLVTALSGQDRMMLIAPKDIGVIGAAVLVGEERDRWHGKVVNLGGRSMTMEEVTAVLSEDRGISVKLEQVGTEEKSLKYEVQRWLMPAQNIVNSDDVEELFGIQLTGLTQFLKDGD